MYKGAVGAILIFNPYNKQTFIEGKNWVEDVKKQPLGKIPLMIISNRSANKKSSDEAFDLEEVKKFAESEDGIYLETDVDGNFNFEETIKNFIINIAKFVKEVKKGR